LIISHAATAAHVNAIRTPYIIMWPISSKILAGLSAMGTAPVDCKTTMYNKVAIIRHTSPLVEFVPIEFDI
jgi:hypothetical protein